MIHYTPAKPGDGTIPIHEMKTGQTGVIVGGDYDGSPVMCMCLSELFAASLIKGHAYTWRHSNQWNINVRLCDFDLVERK